MPMFRPVSDLSSHADAICDYCRSTREPVFLLQNGESHVVVLSIEAYQAQTQVEENHFAADAREHFLTVARQLQGYDQRGG